MTFYFNLGTVTARDIAPPTDFEALRRLKNSIYRGQLQIVIPGPGILEVFIYYIFCAVLTC